MLSHPRKKIKCVIQRYVLVMGTGSVQVWVEMRVAINGLYWNAWQDSIDWMTGSLGWDWGLES
eukprot:7906135-Ditylum_brightwellii.AAC.1